jgi:hypothetical protein
MAQAQVVLTAVDRTQAAINSALKGMKTLERTAKVTARAVNLAFGFFTGSLLVSAFEKITKAAQGTEEGRKAIDRLNTALKDPTIVSAVNTFTSALITGFSKVVEVTARVIENITAISRSSFLKSPDTMLKFLSSVMGGGIGGSAALVADMVRGSVGAGGAAATTSAAAVSTAAPKAVKGGKGDGIPNALRSLYGVDDAGKYITEIENDIEQGLIDLRDKFAEELERGGELGETIFDNVEESVSQLTVFAQEAARQMQQSFADFLFDPFKNGLKGMLSGFLNVIRRMIAEAAAATILQSLFGGFIGQGGFLGALAGALIPAGNTRAMGGSVSAGTPYLVGERGPEMFVPGTSGNIVPNNKMGGVTVSPVYNIDARGASADLQDALPGILAENNRRIFDELDRRYGIGR